MQIDNLKSYPIVPLFTPKKQKLNKRKCEKECPFCGIGGTITPKDLLWARFSGSVSRSVLEKMEQTQRKWTRRQKNWILQCEERTKTKICLLSWDLRSNRAERCLKRCKYISHTREFIFKIAVKSFCGHSDAYKISEFLYTFKIEQEDEVSYNAYLECF